MARRNFSNTATPTSLTSNASNSTVTLNVAATAQFPSVPFTAAIDRGTADEEAVLVTAVTATTMTVQRGFDDTTAVAHNSGAAVEHTLVADDLDTANAHIYDDSRDDHPQYLNEARAAIFYPKPVNATAPVKIDPITASYQTTNTLTIPSATFSRKVQISGLVPILAITSALYRVRILMDASTVVGYSYSIGPSLVSLPILSDWITLPSGSAYQFRTQIRRDAGSGGNTDDDPDYNKLTALVVPNV